MVGKNTDHFLVCESYKNIAKIYKNKSNFDESKVVLQQYEKFALKLYGERSL
jgi:hypothetical protein